MDRMMADSDDDLMEVQVQEPMNADLPEPLVVDMVEPEVHALQDIGEAGLEMQDQDDSSEGRETVSNTCKEMHTFSWHIALVI